MASNQEPPSKPSSDFNQEDIDLHAEDYWLDVDGWGARLARIERNREHEMAQFLADQAAQETLQAPQTPDAQRIGRNPTGSPPPTPTTNRIGRVASGSPPPTPTPHRIRRIAAASPPQTPAPRRIGPIATESLPPTPTPHRPLRDVSRQDPTPLVSYLSSPSPSPLPDNLATPPQQSSSSATSLPAGPGLLLVPRVPSPLFESLWA